MSKVSKKTNTKSIYEQRADPLFRVWLADGMLILEDSDPLEMLDEVSQFII